jgi:hypothetical protein
LGVPALVIMILALVMPFGIDLTHIPLSGFLLPKGAQLPLGKGNDVRLRRGFEDAFRSKCLS